MLYSSDGDVIYLVQTTTPYDYTSMTYSDNSFEPFSGNFDGDNHTISGLKINNPDSDDTGDQQGLFGYAYDATIKNLTISEPSIAGRHRIGALCGNVSTGTTIENIVVEVASVSELNGKVNDMNTAANTALNTGNYVYYTVGASDSTPPTLTYFDSI